MKTHNERWIHGMTALVALGLFSGCSTMSDEDKTKAQSIGVFGAVGSVIGGVIGHQMGDATVGAVVGGVAGATGGALYGDHVVKKKSDYASQEDYLQACIGQAEEMLTLATEYNSTLVTEVANLDAEVTSTMEAYQQKQNQKEDVLAVQTALAEKHKDAAESLAAITEEIKQQRSVLEAEAGNAASGTLKKLEEKIAKLEEQKAELTEHTSRLASIQSRISV